MATRRAQVWALLGLGPPTPSFICRPAFKISENIESPSSTSKMLLLSRLTKIRNKNSVRLRNQHRNWPTVNTRITRVQVFRHFLVARTVPLQFRVDDADATAGPAGASSMQDGQDVLRTAEISRIVSQRVDESVRL